MFNREGIKFLQHNARPLAVDSTERAGKVLQEALEKRRKAIAAGNIVIDDEKFAQHLAWLIGFDTLIEGRKAIYDLVSKLEA